MRRHEAAEHHSAAYHLCPGPSGSLEADRAGACAHRIGPVVVLHTSGYVGARCDACATTLSQWLGEARDGLYIELRGLVEDVKHHLHRVHRDTDDKSIASLHACAGRIPAGRSTASYPSTRRRLYAVSV